VTVTSTTADAAEHLDRGSGRLMRLLLDAGASHGRVSALLCEHPAATAGPPLHVHPGTDEWFWVLAGTLLVHADGQLHRLDPGDSAFVPRGSAHTFAGAPGEAVRFLTVHTPGGFEQMHREVVAAERVAQRPLTPAEIIPIARRHDWLLAGPPLLPHGELAGPPGPTATPTHASSVMSSPDT
jgi:mannose-6-phosphate isomerase-like protein (cupin superfamily)